MVNVIDLLDFNVQEIYMIDINQINMNPSISNYFYN